MSGLCLDAASDGPGAVHQSPCSRDDLGQVWYRSCDSDGLMSEGAGTRLTWWNADDVSATHDVGDRAEHRWTVHPRHVVCT